MLSKGHQILAANWRCGSLEVDLISQVENIIVFSEVKTRMYNAMVDPAEGVNRTKQKQIMRAAERYMENQPDHLECRFDIIAVSYKGNSYMVEHLEDAYRHFMK